MDHSADLPQIIEAPLKKRLVGKDTQASCTGRFIGEGNLHWVKIFADDSLGRAGFLHFGNQLDTAARGKRGEEVSHSRRILELLSQPLCGNRSFSELDFLSLASNDFIKDGQAVLFPSGRRIMAYRFTWGASC